MPKRLAICNRRKLLFLVTAIRWLRFPQSSTQQYFKEANIRFFNAALSGENSAFFDFLLSKIRLDAKIVIVDISPFFVSDASMSSVGRFIVESPARAAVEYQIKQIWQTVHRYSCVSESAFRSRFCGKVFSTFRSIEDGRLIADYALAYGSPLPKIPVALRNQKDAAESELRTKLAREFIVRNNLDAGCLILTAIPTGYDRSSLAKYMAHAIGASYINPFVDGLSMIDAAHLDLPSATAWSERFWNEATPIIYRCLK